MDTLMANPFNIQDESLAMLIARYMVEDNDKDYIILDMQKSATLPVAKSIFKQLVGNYKVPDLPSELVLSEKIAHVLLANSLYPLKTLKVLNRYREHIMNQFHSLPAAKEGFVSLELFFDTLVSFEIILTPEQIDYLTLRIYQISTDLKKIEFKKIFESFPEDASAREKIIQENHQKHHTEYDQTDETHSENMSEYQETPKNYNAELKNSFNFAKHMNLEKLIPETETRHE